ncbi:MAG: tetratricopeptide repeat protein [Polyangiaceae bacterium]|jgi:tetratricopeptide (TPR) repeat protein
MHGPPPRQPGGSSFPPPAFSLDAKIDDAGAIVDAMLASLARGRLSFDSWEQLHMAARRDGRVDEVASAFVTVSQGPRIKSVQPSVAAEFLFQAARFSDDVFGDDLGAAMYLERTLALAPAHPGSFAKMEAILEKRKRLDLLAELYVTAAPHRSRGQQALMLRRAAGWLAHPREDDRDRPAVDDRMIDLWQQIVRLEPGDGEALTHLEVLCTKAGRFRDAVRLNEQALAADPAPDEYSKRTLLERIVELYADRLDEPKRAIGYVEQLLWLDPGHEGAHSVAERLLLVNGLAGRAAAALAKAFEMQGIPDQVARCLSIELEGARGQGRVQLFARLGRLRQEQLGDHAGALEAYDQGLLLDPGDNDLRARYVDVAIGLGRHADALKVLERVIATVRDPAVKARASTQLGEMLLGQGEVKRAKTVLTEVLAWCPPADAELRAARALREIHERAYDRASLCDVLDRLAMLEQDDDKRRETNERLAAVATKLRDIPRAIEAWERLLRTSARPFALEELAKLYRGSGQSDKYAHVLDVQSTETDDAEKARRLLVRAADVRLKQLKDEAAAIATYRMILQRFGPDRETYAILEELFTRAERWDDLRSHREDYEQMNGDSAREVRRQR